MLQQTRVEAAKGYYARFLQRLPDVTSLAQVSEDELMKLWQGLGYYNRARNLQKCAKTIVAEYDGIFPNEYEELLRLPGIGEYTAGAIASIAFSKPVPAIDGNVYRIYTRLFADDSDITKAAFKKELRALLLAVIPPDAPALFNQAWMDLGATVCLPNGAPLCNECPLHSYCEAFSQNTWQNFPKKPSKKERKIEERTVILLEYQGKYLLQKRPPRGLLAGLWEFPAQEGFLSLPEVQEMLSNQHILPGQIELLGKGKHIFSHIEWHMLGYLIHLHEHPLLPLSGESVWVTKEKMQREYSIPSALRCYYLKLFQ
jgi:A/G-specific adenine glycosylase